MEKRALVLLLISFFPVALMQQQQQQQQIGRRKIQSETRIKLPSDIAFTHESTGDIEGEACFNLVRRTNGICTLPNQCPEAIRDFQKGIQPQICNYKGHLPIICCPRSQKPASVPIVQPVAPSNNVYYPSTTTTTTTTTGPTVAPPLQPKPSLSPPAAPAVPSYETRISEQKCKQYMKLMIEESVVTTFSLNPENITVQTTKCAKPSSEGFIVGGTATEHGEFPHMAIIGWQQDENGPIDWNCGGSLISYRFVLSAAHCVSWRGIKPKIIRLGSQNLKRSDDPNVEDFGILQSIRHPSYRPSSKYNDIALFELSRDVQINDFIRPACLWQKFDIKYPSGIATGWGLTKDRGRPSDELLKVQLNFITNERCNGFYQRFGALKNGIIDSQLCAGDDVEEKDTCSGDSGGPLQVATQKSACTYHVIGVTSFGMGCGNGYGVYTRISEYLDWIESIVWKNSN
ncbi:serine protease snake-like [Sitodiplosis mosellana]|uniref:serine protease snake-like n=1 Tax=Sitodiplosis mosellana TaxID=263140 RepID=UPI002443F52D|nr:serine protease snake-like [Sitodiplosis mosellana]